MYKNGYIKKSLKDVNQKHQSTQLILQSFVFDITFQAC